MGIKGLYKVITNNTSDCILEKDIRSYRGKVIAIDASLLLYQFVIAIRNNGSDLTDNKGNSTSHLYAIFIKTIKFLENGIKPVYVFDGKPPELKKNVLRNRRKIRENAKKKLLQLDKQSKEGIKNFKRTVVITRQQIDECKQLLDVMKIPYVNSPGEADAQCAVLAKEGKVWGVCTEDMDILTFGAPRILKQLSSSKSRKVIEIDLKRVLSSLGLTNDQFIDLCILLGSDYCPTICGIGQKRALPLIRNMKNIDNLLNMIKEKKIKTKTNDFKYKIPIYYPYKQTKEYFNNPLVDDPKTFDFKWDKLNMEEVIEFMHGKYNFKKTQIVKKLRKYDFFYDRLFNPIKYNKFDKKRFNKHRNKNRNRKPITIDYNNKKN